MCQVLQELGFGLTRGIVTKIICDFLSASARPSPFSGSLPGADWWMGFLQRWPALSERKPQHLSTGRASCANPQTVGSWFERVKSFYSNVGLLVGGEFVAEYEHRIWNSDESGFCLGVTSKKVLARKGSRAVHEVGGASDHQYITVNVCGNAAGLRLPPYILYKGKNLYNTWTTGGPAGACYGVSQSGWMEEISFMKWFEMQFFPAVKHLVETGPVVMFFDGHYSHLSIALIKKAKSLGIHLLCLPPNTTHILQPLDVGVFGPVKSEWRKILKCYKLKTRASNVTKDEFPGLIKELWEKSIKPEHLRGGFKSAGLAPFNPGVISPHRLSPSLVSSGAPSPESPTASPEPPGVHMTAVGSLRIAGSETPIRVELRAFFVQALKPAEKKGPRRRRRVELSDYGEVLTSDEVLEQLEQAEAEKQKKKEAAASKKKTGRKSKKASKKSSQSSQESDSYYCTKCHLEYTDDEADEWIGCNACDSWWHYWCAGLDTMLTEDDEWICERCDRHD